ncbi:hypothetical protein FE257_011169 [Aspergillus nanangensis]|uniref:Zn(2)-C6 fungal-type domain-containing protein n=1 Tax=Aspergillus nanangensis TaxID=2582783 RepID=A0AAD4CI99_ASPNN|nr:hypothetical protein FE257_011169 [Aspergillus nanangensis]
MELPMSKTSGPKRSWVADNPGTVSLSSVACQQCRARKVKCGGEYPECLECSKAGVPCIIADPTAPREYTRTEVFELQQKLHHLKSRLRSSTSGQDVPNNPQGPEELQPTPPNLRENRYVGQENGISFFLSRLLSGHNHPGLSASLKGKPAPHGPGFVYQPPHTFPSPQTASLAVTEYFRGDYVAHPFLDPAKIHTTLEKQSKQSISACDKHSLFQLNMVMAIGSIGVFRSGRCDLHPFGFFTAALEVNPPSASSFNSLEDIENFLLIARFGSFYDIGIRSSRCSLWELGRLCVRICVELGLHRLQPRHLNNESLDIERCRKLFWESYLLDRYSSSTLGRPFAIGDASIAAPLPRSSDDTNSILNWQVGLSQLTSKLYNLLRKRHFSHTLDITLSPTADAGDTLSLLRNFHSCLREWRQKAPFFESPICMEQTQQLFDVLCQESRLRLLRVTIDKLSFGSRMPPQSLLRPCYQAACHIILSFETLRRLPESLVTFNRTYTHLIFIAGLVVAFMINIQLSQDRQRPDDLTSGIDLDYLLDDLLDDHPTYPSAENVWDRLSAAGELLSWFSETIPDVSVYSCCFDNLKRGLDSARPVSRTCNAPAGNPLPSVEASMVDHPVQATSANPVMSQQSDYLWAVEGPPETWSLQDTPIRD